MICPDCDNSGFIEVELCGLGLRKLHCLNPIHDRENEKWITAYLPVILQYLV